VLGKTRGIERPFGHIQSVNSSGFSVVSGYINVRCDHTAVSEGTPRVTEHRIELGDLLLDLFYREGLDSIPGAADEADPRRSVEFHPPTISPEDRRGASRLRPPAQLDALVQPFEMRQLARLEAVPRRYPCREGTVRVGGSARYGCCQVTDLMWM
jgi:hypothetical protein